MKKVLTLNTLYDKLRLRSAVKPRAKPRSSLIPTEHYASQ